MNKLFLIISYLICSFNVFGQYNGGQNFYLGFLAGKGVMHGKESLVGGPNPTNDYATYEAKTTPFAMTALFETHGTKKINLGTYMGATIGAGNTKYFYDIKNTTLDGPGESFDFLLDMRIGLQLTHASDNNEYFFGLRYFNWYNGDALRSQYTNADDAAAIGLFGGYKNWGIDLNIAPKHLPGFLVRNEFNYGQLEIRYKGASFDNNNYALFLGTRIEISSYKGETFGQGFLGYEDAKSTLIAFVIGFGANNK